MVKNRDEIHRQWEDGAASGHASSKVYEWFCAARAKNIPVSEKIIQEKAVMYSLGMGHDDFTTSNGWLY